MKLLILFMLFFATETYARGIGENQSESALAERNFIWRVNHFAIQPSGLIVGFREKNHECELRLLNPNDPQYADMAETVELASLYQEIKKSSIESEIRRFNKPLTARDRHSFQVDPKECVVQRYVGSKSSYHPPSTERAYEFIVRYSSENFSEIALELKHPNKKPVYVFEGKETISKVDLKNCSESKSSCHLGSKVVQLYWGDVYIADWYRNFGNWSVLRNFNIPKGVVLRLHNMKGVGDGKQIRAETIIPFSSSVTLTLHQFTGHRMRQLATVSVLDKSDRNFLFKQLSSGIAKWSRPPSHFEAQIVDALRSAFRSDGTNLQKEIQLSLDPTTNQTFDRIVENAARAMEHSNPHQILPYASIAMIDAETGEVIGASGYPFKQKPKKFVDGNYEASQEQEEFLVRRDIGSVAKVPISFAILVAHPQLRNLRLGIYPAGQFNTVLGQEIAPFKDHSSQGCGAYVDFSCFIAKSLNRYAETLLSLAAVKQVADPTRCEGKPLGQDRFWLGDVACDKQPLGFIYKEPPDGSTVAQLLWAKKASELFGIAMKYDAGYARTPESHTYTWQYVSANGLDNNKSSLFLNAFNDVSPEKENFRLNLAHDFRTEYLPLILGGGESRWSAIKVAETFARVVTLKKVEASFIVKPKKHKSAKSLFNAEEMNEALGDAHNKMLIGLRGVLEQGGTASFLDDTLAKLRGKAIEKQCELYAYAKTGTPEVDSSISQENPFEVSELIKKGILKVSAKENREDGYVFLYQNNSITQDLLNHIPDENAAQFGGRKAQREKIRFLAAFNSESRINQKYFCIIQGQKVLCPKIDTVSRLGNEGDRDGRNFALLIQLKGKTGKVHKSVSLAYSNSIKPPKKEGEEKDIVFRKMIRDSLAVDGSVADYLQLTNEEMRCENE